jgi:hypothetical protein
MRQPVQPRRSLLFRSDPSALFSFRVAATCASSVATCCRRFATFADSESARLCADVAASCRRELTTAKASICAVRFPASSSSAEV